MKATKPKKPQSKWFKPGDPRVKVRRCIICRTEFWSAHAGHRICTKCKDKVEQL
jgi:hypothetical protein